MNQVQVNKNTLKLDMCSPSRHPPCHGNYSCQTVMRMSPRVFLIEPVSVGLMKTHWYLKTHLMLAQRKTSTHTCKHWQKCGSLAIFARTIFTCLSLKYHQSLKGTHHAHLEDYVYILGLYLNYNTLATHFCDFYLHYYYGHVRQYIKCYILMHHW